MEPIEAREGYYDFDGSLSGGGGGGSSMGKYKGGSIFSQISSLYGTLAAMNAYSNGTINAIQTEMLRNMTTVTTYNITRTYGSGTQSAGLYGYKGGENVPNGDVITNINIRTHSQLGIVDISAYFGTPQNFFNNTMVACDGCPTLGVKLPYNNIGINPQNFGTISTPQKTIGDRIQNFFILGGILDNAFVPFTKMTKTLGQPLFGDWYGNTHINGEYANSDDAVMGFASTGAMFFGIKLFNYESGGVKQWLRIGKSYSRTGKFQTFGIRWGASPKYAKLIKNPWLRALNQKLRNTKLWWKSWRTTDSGHWHWWIK